MSNIKGVDINFSVDGAFLSE